MATTETAESSFIEFYDDSALNVRSEGFKPVIPIEEDRIYYQVDLGSRFAIEAFAAYYSRGDRRVLDETPPYDFSHGLLLELEEKREASPGSVAVYVRTEGPGDPVATVLATKYGEISSLKDKQRLKALAKAGAIPALGSSAIREVDGVKSYAYVTDLGNFYIDLFRDSQNVARRLSGTLRGNQTEGYDLELEPLEYTEADLAAYEAMFGQDLRVDD